MGYFLLGHRVGSGGKRQMELPLTKHPPHLSTHLFGKVHFIVSLVLFKLVSRTQEYFLFTASTVLLLLHGGRLCMCCDIFVSYCIINLTNIFSV